MIVKLPRPATGQEIIYALEQAGKFSTDERRVFRSSVVNTEIENQPGSVHQVVREMAVKIFSMEPVRKFGLWGSLVFKDDSRLQVELESVQLDKTYNEVNIRPWFMTKDVVGGNLHLRRGCGGLQSCDPLGQGFARVQKDFEVILERFYRRFDLPTA